MSKKLPYLVNPGTVTNVMLKIREARQPEIFTQDFLSTKLGFKGGNARPIIPLMKKMGFLNNDGKPTELYSSYRNETTSKWAVATGLKTAFSELYDTNEYAHELSRKDLSNLIIQLTGLESDNKIVSSTVSTFENLKALADFEQEEPKAPKLKSFVMPEAEDSIRAPADASSAVAMPSFSKTSTGNGVGLNLSYTINLNLPETSNIEVFNAIFSSLKENLLKA